MTSLPWWRKLFAIERPFELPLPKPGQAMPGDVYMDTSKIGKTTGQVFYEGNPVGEVVDVDASIQISLPEPIWTLGFGMAPHPKPDAEIPIRWTSDGFSGLVTHHDYLEAALDASNLVESAERDCGPLGWVVIAIRGVGGRTPDWLREHVRQALEAKAPIGTTVVVLERRTWWI